MELYDLTRKLVARGCPEHPRLQCNSMGQWWHRNCVDRPFDGDDARAIWAQWALEWYASLESPSDIHAVMPVGVIGEAAVMGTILEAIEAATRHMESAKAS